MDYGGALGSSSSAGGCWDMAVDGEFLREEVAVGEVSLLTMVTVGSSSNPALHDEGKTMNLSPTLDGDEGA
jgi:hypothetical protein